MRNGVRWTLLETGYEYYCEVVVAGYVGSDLSGSVEEV